MSPIKPGDILVLSMQRKKSRKWRTQELTVISIHKGKSFGYLTVSNGVYRETLDIWAIKCEIKKGKAKLIKKRAI